MVNRDSQRVRQSSALYGYLGQADVQEHDSISKLYKATISTTTES